LSDLDSDPTTNKPSLLNVKIFKWLRFLVLMQDTESKKLEKKLLLQIQEILLILGCIKIVIRFYENN